MHGTAGTRWLRSLGIAVLLLAATACSGDPPPAGAVDTPTPSVQSSTPTPTTPTPVEQQVEAAVRAYYAELTRAAQTKDTSRLKTMSRTGCPCSGSVRSIDKTRKIGHKIPDAAWTVESSKVHDVIAHSAGARSGIDVAGLRRLRSCGKVRVTSVAQREMHVDLHLITRGEALAASPTSLT